MEPTKNKNVKAIPEGMHSVTPFIMVKNAEGLIDFLKEAFDAKQTYMMKAEGEVMHATVTIGDSVIMLSDAMDPYQPMPCQLYLYVEDIDKIYDQAVEAGATSIREPRDEFYGDRSAGVKDDWGNIWWVATHIEDVSEEEIKKREEEFRKQQKAGKVQGSN